MRRGERIGLLFFKVVSIDITDLQNTYFLPDNSKYYVIPLFAVAAFTIIK